MKIKNLVGVMSLVIALAIPGTSFAKDLWSNTGLKPTHLTNYLNQSRCYKSEKSFLGCLAAAQSLFNGSDLILTNKVTANLPGVGNVLKVTQGLKIQYRIPAPESNNDFLARKKESTEIKATALQSWKDVYKLTKNKKSIQFAELYKEGLASVGTQRSQRSYIAAALNSYFMNAIDPHTRLISDDEMAEANNEFQPALASTSDKPEEVENVEATLATDPKTQAKVGYIQIHSFMGKHICEQFLYYAIDLHNSGAQSLVLDLRDNDGGSVNEATCIAKTFIDAGKTVLIEQDPISNKTSDRMINDAGNAATIYNLYNKKPLVVLLNGGSASAAEMLPGALQAYGRAILVGEKSYGKGTMQDEYLFPDDLGYVMNVRFYTTVARFHFADGSTNQLVGLAPDFEVYKKANMTEEQKYFEREADTFTNAYVSTKTPVGMAAAKKAVISQCIQNRNSNIAQSPDMQLATAREVAICLK